MKNILLIGDSIRLGYDKYVKMAFEDIANVYYPQENCRFSSYIIRNLRDWVNQTECGNDIDLIHWNAGLWDDLIMLDGKHLVSLDEYKNNIERICNLIKIILPQAKMIFATSTPVQEELFTSHKRYNKDTEAYNVAAVEIVKKFGGEINDLYSLMVNLPVEYHSDLTHYYTREGTEAITNHVIAHIENTLNLKAKNLDYNALFNLPENTIGI